MFVKKIEYKNLNGLSNSFELSEGLNVFSGSNGSGKTTTIDALAILLFGESYSYAKTLEKHINVNDKTQKAECKMVIATDNKYLDEDGKECFVEIEISNKMELKADGKFSNSYFIGSNKSTRAKVDEKLCELFSIPRKFLEIEKINVMRALVDPNYLGTADNIGFYNLIKELTHVVTIQEFANQNEEFASIRGIINLSNDIPDAEKAIKNEISLNEDKITLSEKELSELDEKIKENEWSKEKQDSYNDKIDIYNEKRAHYSKLGETAEKLKKDIHVSRLDDAKQLLANKDKCVAELNTINNNIQSINNNLYEIYLDINKIKINIDSLESKIRDLENSIDSEKNSQFEKVICPECQTFVNKDSYDAFEEEKKTKISKYCEELENAKNGLTQNKGDLTIKNECVDKYSKELSALESKRNELIKTINSINISEVSPSENTNKLVNDLDTAEKEIEKLTEELTALGNELSELSYDYSEIEKTKERKKIIEGLIADYKDRKAIVECKQVQMKDFKIAYAKNIETKVGSVFGEIAISMVKEGKNAKEKVSCFATKDGKPLYNYNTAPQKAIGVEMINNIKNHLGIKGLPIVFDILDNVGEKAVNEIVEKANGQVLCTKIDYKDGIKLHLEKEIK